MEGKRKLDGRDANSSALVVKKQKTDELVPAGEGKGKEIIAQGPARTSSLSAPILLLTGHQAEIYTVKFDPTGDALASGSFDKKIFLWRVYGESENFAVLEGHKNAVLDLCWSADSSQIYSASADKTASVWDVRTFRRIRKLTEHNSIVNCCSVSTVGSPILATGSDDGTAKLWDVRTKKSVHSLEHRYQTTAVALASDAETLFTGGLDNIIRAWDVRKGRESFQIRAHKDTITGLRLSPDGHHLLSNSMDNTLQIHDVRPFAPDVRTVKTFSGHMHGFDQNLLKCSWSPDGSKVSAGSADRFVTVWSVATREILYKLPGHAGTVNEVDFHPKEPVLVSGGADAKLFLGELQA